MDGGEGVADWLDWEDALGTKQGTVWGLKHLSNQADYEPLRQRDIDRWVGNERRGNKGMWEGRMRG